MKVKCKLYASYYISFGIEHADINLYYKKEKQFFYKRVSFQIRDFNNNLVVLSEKDMIEEIAKMKIDDVKALCSKIITRDLDYDNRINNRNKNMSSTIDKINNMKFEIELDLKGIK